MDFFDKIANGNGVIAFFSDIQLNGSYYSAPVLAQMNVSASDGAAGRLGQVATLNGVFENAILSKVDFYRKIKEFVLPTAMANSYDFQARIFINEIISVEETISLILDGDILDFVNDGNTTELTFANDTEGFLLKMIG